MQNKNKLILKQLGLFSFVMLFFYSFGHLVPTYHALNLFDEYEFFGFSFWILLIFFVPFYLMYLIKRQDKNVKFIHNTFKIIAWILSPFFIILFFMSLWEALSMGIQEYGFFEIIYFKVSLYFDLYYLTDFSNEYGIKSDLIEYLYAGGYLIAVVVLYWAVKTNKKFISYSI